MTDNLVQFKLRIPKELYAFVAEHAVKNNRTRNNQMVTWIKEKMHEQHKTEA